MRRQFVFAALAAAVAAKRVFPALVLTYDARRPFARLMISRYDALWPTHPFRFYVPTQTRSAAKLGRRVTFVPAPDSGISATMLALLDAATANATDDALVYFAADDKYPVAVDAAVADAAAAAAAATRLAGLHVGCFRQSRAVRASCKAKRNATPAAVLPCEAACRCFYCHHFERAWLLRAFFSYTLGLERAGRIDHAKQFDAFKNQAIKRAVAGRAPGAVGEGFATLAGDAVLFEESTHRGKITTKTRACLGSCARDLPAKALPAVKFNINPAYACEPVGACNG